MRTKELYEKDDGPGGERLSCKTSKLRRTWVVKRGEERDWSILTTGFADAIEQSLFSPTNLSSLHSKPAVLCRSLFVQLPITAASHNHHSVQASSELSPFQTDL